MSLCLCSPSSLHSSGPSCRLSLPSFAAGVLRSPRPSGLLSGQPGLRSLALHPLFVVWSSMLPLAFCMPSGLSCIPWALGFVGLLQVLLVPCALSGLVSRHCSPCPRGPSVLSVLGSVRALPESARLGLRPVRRCLRPSCPSGPSVLFWRHWLLVSLVGVPLPSELLRPTLLLSSVWSAVLGVTCSPVLVRLGHSSLVSLLLVGSMLSGQSVQPSRPRCLRVPSGPSCCTGPAPRRCWSWASSCLCIRHSLSTCSWESRWEG